MSSGSQNKTDPLPVTPLTGPSDRHSAEIREGRSVPTLNTGFILLNKANLTPEQAAAICVIGMPRGGTTMAAKLLEAAGVFMGESLPVTAEDPEFAQLLMGTNPDEALFKRLVTQRGSMFSRWGFKAPFRY